MGSQARQYRKRFGPIFCDIFVFFISIFPLKLVLEMDYLHRALLLFVRLQGYNPRLSAGKLSASRRMFLGARATKQRRPFAALPRSGA
ncbi:hypothetical protein DMR_40550 [Solidesulfovibrio magneticus RS-1]|uniref:Uncharacterized protein n=1 Tax=Solidesulfovibrio magneticus (strain ATCC 700980 / DSM 13731 / RS-1) TaxID=573370 RepID=C4XP44_SOLM1|nr:hypothetical protein DMR_40550 [Solidesulfovibrio magneticus RS-1]